MVYMLNTTLRTKIFPIIKQRDEGFYCLYCNKNLNLKNYVIDHLNDNPYDNRIENLAFSCQPCNIKKIANIQLKLVAKAKLQQNEIESSRHTKLLEDFSKPEPSTEIAISQSSYNITHQYLLERIQVDGSIDYTNAINSASMICKKKTGYGSQQATRNYIDMLTSDEGPFMVSRDEKNKKIIVKRTD